MLAARFSLFIVIVLSLSPCRLVEAEESATAPFKVGVASRRFLPDKTYNWRHAATHELLTTVWYPGDAASVEQPQWIGPPASPLFSAGSAAPDAKLSSAPAKFPLVVLSHGTGGSALMMAWLGTVLASHGYIAAAVNHPGNNATEDYTAEGFTFWWERATDLTVVIDQMLRDATFGARIDANRIGAAGFSLGGYTMIEIAGGITVPAAFDRFCKSSKADAICKSPPEFPDLRAKYDQLTKLAKNDAVVADAFHHASDSRRDGRVRAVFAIAPALGPAFDTKSLEKISIPVEIVAGDADQNVPVASSAKYFAAHIAEAKLTLLSGGVGHYVFLDTCTDAARHINPVLCTDGPGVDRADIHSKTAEMALSFFDSNLR